MADQLCRSRSFGGGGGRPPSKAGTITSLGSTQSWQQNYSAGVSPVGSKRHPPSVLGQNPPTTPKELRRTLSLPPHVKVPKSPRPERSVVVGEAVIRGLREGVAVTVQDLVALRRLRHASHRAMSHGRLYEAEKQMKVVERYQKRLEFHLSQVEDLLDQYQLHQKLREGARTMAYAYAASPGKERTQALNSVRSGYRECTDTLCGLEVQIENLIGTFTLEMKGIQGFARLCAGDVFEVTLKHGRQKWRSRGRVGKDASQTWDNSKTVFKALIGEVLILKAVEVKLLGKSVLIGARECDTKDLYVPHPQLMTVNLNHSGSLKLNIIVTWKPLESHQEDTLMRSSSLSSSTAGGGAVTSGRYYSSGVCSPTPPSVTRLLSRQNISPSIPESTADTDSSFGSLSARSSSSESSASPLPPTDSTADTSNADNSGSRECLSCSSSSVSPSCDASGNFTLVRKKETRTEQWARYSQFSISSSSTVELLSRSYPHLPSLSSPTPYRPSSPHAPPSTSSSTASPSSQPRHMSPLVTSSSPILSKLVTQTKPSDDTLSSCSSVAKSLPPTQSSARDISSSFNDLDDSVGSNGNDVSSASLANLPAQNTSLQSLLNAINNCNSTQSLQRLGKVSSFTPTPPKKSTVADNVLFENAVQQGLLTGEGDNSRGASPSRSSEHSHPLSKLSCQSLSSTSQSSQHNLNENVQLLCESASPSHPNKAGRTSSTSSSSSHKSYTEESSSSVSQSSSGSSGSKDETQEPPVVIELTESSPNNEVIMEDPSPNEDGVLSDSLPNTDGRIPQIPPVIISTNSIEEEDSVVTPPTVRQLNETEGRFMPGVVDRDASRWLASADAWDPRTIPCTLTKLVTRVHTCLEDVQGQWPVLQPLEDVLQELRTICKEPSRRQSVSSQASLSVEAALGCFDFLDAEDDDHHEEGADGDRGKQRPGCEQDPVYVNIDNRFTGAGGMVASASTEMNGMCTSSVEEYRQMMSTHRGPTSSLESRGSSSFRSNLNSLESKSSGKSSSHTNTLEDKSTQSSEGSKSSDSSTLEDKSRSSGQSSLSNTLEDKSGKSAEFSSGTSTLELEVNVCPATEGEFQHVEGCIEASKELEKCFYVHLRRVFRLLQNLGSCGPLRQLETWSVCELEREAAFLSSILKHSDDLHSLRPHHLLNIPHVQVLWDSVTATSDCWCVPGDAVVKGLLPVVTSLVPPHHTATLPTRVLQRLVETMTDGYRGSFCGREVVTAGHFLHHLRPPLQTTVPAVASSLLLCDAFKQQQADGVIRSLADLTYPQGLHVRAIGDLLHSGPPHLVHHLTEYVSTLHYNEQLFSQMMESCLMELESKNSDDRVAACVLLATVAGLIPTIPSTNDNTGNDVKNSEGNTYELLASDGRLDVPLYINEETPVADDHSSSSNSSVDNSVEQKNTVPSSLPQLQTQQQLSKALDKKKKKESSESVFSQLLGRRRSNASSTSSTKSTKSNVDSGISSTSPKRGSLVSSLESSSSTDANKKLGAAAPPYSIPSSSKNDIMSSSYPSASSLHHTIFSTPHVSSSSPVAAVRRPHSSYHSSSTPTPPPSALPPLPTRHPPMVTSMSQIIEVLSFVQQSDRSHRVQRAARQGLQQLGREAEATLQQWTLSAHGFQGVVVKGGDGKRYSGGGGGDNDQQER